MANSTGVYSGVESSANGNSDDASNLDNIALRGIQQADDDGVVQFSTIFPGHYTGRATHIVSQVLTWTFTWRAFWTQTSSHIHLINEPF